MGHERIGYLPKTRKWSAIVADLSAYSSSSSPISAISSNTLKNVRSKFSNIINDTGVVSAFEFLVLLSLIPQKKEWKEYLSKKGILLDDNFSLLQISANAKAYISKNEMSKEYSAVAIQAVVDSIAEWSNVIKQGNLFQSHTQQSEIWREAAKGSGFCELSRLFFSKFTERYLKYFLDRESFGKIKNLTELSDFNSHLKNHVDLISKHAFETAKITQSFSAGWYNKHVNASLPSHEKIKNFLSYSFKKLNSELSIEELNG
jgi:hypothetical protein